jgi:hypothetical protein
MRSKELSVELRDRIMSRHRSGEGYQNISVALKVPKNTVASIILKWKKFGTTKRLPRAGHPAKQSNQVKMVLVREVTKNLMVNDRALEFLCGDGRTFQNDKHLCSIPPIRPLFSKRHMTGHLEFAKRTLKPRKKKFPGLMKPRLNSLA